MYADLEGGAEVGRKWDARLGGYIHKMRDGPSGVFLCSRDHPDVFATVLPSRSVKGHAVKGPDERANEAEQPVPDGAVSRTGASHVVEEGFRVEVHGDEEEAFAEAKQNFVGDLVGGEACGGVIAAFELLAEGGLEGLLGGEGVGVDGSGERAVDTDGLLVGVEEEFLTEGVG